VKLVALALFALTVAWLLSESERQRRHHLDLRETVVSVGYRLDSLHARLERLELQTGPNPMRPFP
jgi:hypothetical protein